MGETAGEIGVAEAIYETTVLQAKCRPGGYARKGTAGVRLVVTTFPGAEASSRP
jgi:hypothetical protein